MPKQIIWSPLAENDFENILEYLEKKWGEKIAYQFIEISSIILRQISAKPKLFPLINKKLKIRRCVLTKHNSIYYRESTTQIEILRIFDTRQDADKLTFK